MLKWLLIFASAFLAIYALDHRWREQRRWSRVPSNVGDSGLYLHRDTGHLRYFNGGV